MSAPAEIVELHGTRWSAVARADSVELAWWGVATLRRTDSFGRGMFTVQETAGEFLVLFEPVTALRAQLAEEVLSTHATSEAAVGAFVALRRQQADEDLAVRRPVRDGDPFCVVRRSAVIIGETRR